MITKRIYSEEMEVQRHIITLATSICFYHRHHISQHSKITRMEGVLPHCPGKPEQATKNKELKKCIRVTWRQCNTRDTVGGIMCKHSGDHPSFKNRNNHD